MSYRTDPAPRARSTITRLLVAGLLIVIVGATLAVLTWPRAELGAQVFTTEDDGLGSSVSGRRLLSLALLGAAGVGQMMVLAAVVAWGVRLGREASPGL